MLTRIHVNQHVIRANKKHGTDEPPLTIKNYKSNTKARQVRIEGPSWVVYAPEHPLSCGAVAWVETLSPVTVER